jgi:sulfonate transport system permease protein
MSDALLEPGLRWRDAGHASSRRIDSRLVAGMRQRAAAVAWLLVLPAFVVPLWIVGSARGWLPEQVLPPPSDVVHIFADTIASGELAQHAGISLMRVMFGFAAGATAGLVLGSVMGLSRRVDDYVRPLFTAIAQVPALAWIPLAMLLLGIGETLKIVVIAKAAFVPVVMNTSAGIANVPRSLIEVGESFCFTPLQMLRHVVVPGAVPPIFTGLRYGLTHAWIALVSVELLASSEGIGYLLVWGRQMFWLDTVLMAMIVIGVIGFASDKILAAVEAGLQRWRTDDV